MLHGQGIQLVAQFTYLIVLGHALGPKGYGTFVSCTAVVLVCAPFAPWGAGQVLVKYASRDKHKLPAYFGNAILLTIVSGSILGGVLMVLRPWILPTSVPAVMLAAVAVADLICTQLTAVCSLAFMALEIPRMSANVLITSSMLRVVASLFLLASSSSPVVWAYLYATVAVVTVVYQVIQVSRVSGVPRVVPSLIWKSVREGFHFATSTSAQTIYDNVDKGMLGRFSSVESAAIYAVAYRFVDASALPIRALAAATYPEFFRRGERGVTATFRFARRILSRSVLYGLFASLILYACAGLVPLVMGPSFAESSAALRWLCPLPFIKSIHAFLTDTLTGGDQQAVRSAVQLGVAAFNVLINLWLIPAYSWRGASWSSLVTDSVLAIVLYIMIRRHVRKEATAGAEALDQPAMKSLVS